MIPAMVAAPRRLRRTVGRRYELLHPLGAGGMGEVWSARHRFTRRPVAVKVVHPAVSAADPAHADRFFEEAALQASVRHPGVVQVLDAGREPDGTLYLVLELLEGHDLESVLRQGRLRPRDLVRVLVGVLDALGACHAAEVVHRDVKPANVFLARSPVRPVEVKLLDFGIATRGRSSERGEVVGTLDYMSPEQARGVEVDARSDIYSASAILYRGLGGRPPHRSLHLSDLLDHLHLRPSLGTLRPDLPADLVETVERGLAIDPLKRWSTAEDMAQALMLCDHHQLDAVGALATEPPAVTADLPSSPWSSRSRARGVTEVDPTVILSRSTEGYRKSRMW
jgi:serine/threonine-protein kinase